jgi:hypothetical protein
MREQPAGGHIFNMDGAGADGGATPRFAACGPAGQRQEGLRGWRMLFAYEEPARGRGCACCQAGKALVIIRRS